MANLRVGTGGRFASMAMLSALLCACGSGGGGDGGGSEEPPPQANRAPVAADVIGDQLAIIGVPFDLDATKGGELFSDPDGDTLDYVVELSGAPPGLKLSGVHITGTPKRKYTTTVTVTADDGHGGSASESFTLSSRVNYAPQVVQPNSSVEVEAGTGIDYDATQGGATFADKNQHALTYDVTILAAPPGFTVQGTHITGMFEGPGLVPAKIEARDPFGGTAEDTFALVVPTPISDRPTLPAESYIYEDEHLPLNNVYTQERDDRLWTDTTPDDNLITNAGATLGRVLFYDKRLSATNTHSCSSCHEQSHGFASAERFPPGALGVPTRRSPMALTGVRYNNQNRYFSDQRAGPLEDLVLMPIKEQGELASSMSALSEELAGTDYYPPLFTAAFGSSKITGNRISKALAQFLRSLISYQSKFDEAHYYVSPEPPPDPEAVLTPEELRGAEVWSAGQCFRCHQTTPAFDAPWPNNNGLDEVITDPGEGEGRFRVASLRNIAVSGPYMHDGRFATLREAIDHYSTGIKANPGLSGQLGGGTEPRRFNFTEQEKSDLEAFFNTLTDHHFLNDPKFSDPFQQ